MLVQLHHYNDRTGDREFQAQTEFPDDLSQDAFNRQLHEWVKGVRERHPLPEGPDWLWFCCNQDVQEFMWAAPPSGDSFDPQENPEAGRRQSEPLEGDMVERPPGL